MLLIGLWHGPAWTFVIWGLWHGLLLSLERLIGWKPTSKAQVWLGRLLTFHLVGLGWVFFRATSLAEAIYFLQGMFSGFGLIWLPRFILPVLLAFALMFSIDLCQNIAKRWPRLADEISPILITLAVVTLIIVQLLATVRGVETNPFIYGSF